MPEYSREAVGLSGINVAGEVNPPQWRSLTRERRRGGESVVTVRHPLRMRKRLRPCRIWLAEDAYFCCRDSMYSFRFETRCWTSASCP